jgi:hypothetical protein
MLLVIRFLRLVFMPRTQRGAAADSGDGAAGMAIQTPKVHFFAELTLSCGVTDNIRYGSSIDDQHPLFSRSSKRRDVLRCSTDVRR